MGAVGVLADVQYSCALALLSAMRRRQLCGLQMVMLEKPAQSLTTGHFHILIICL